MNASEINILYVNEPPRVVQSIQAVLSKDGYLVEILNSVKYTETLPVNFKSPIDALESIRTVRRRFPQQTQIFLVSTEFQQTC